MTLKLPITQLRQKWHLVKNSTFSTSVFKCFPSTILTEKIRCDFEQGAECFRFRLQEQSLDKKLIAARLWIYLQPDTNASGIQRTIVASLPASHYGRRHILSTKQTYVQHGWIELEFPQRHHIMKLFNNPWNFIEIKSLHNSAVLDFIETSSPFTPIFSLIYKLKSRARRTSDSMCSGDCCLVPFTMTFAELNWDWIQPGPFRADYCIGTCRSPTMISSRTQIIQIFNAQNSNVGSPCCVPTSYADLTVFYTGSSPGSPTQQAVISDVRALSCGCVVWDLNILISTCSNLFMVEGIHPNDTLRGYNWQNWKRVFLS